MISYHYLDNDGILTTNDMNAGDIAIIDYNGRKLLAYMFDPIGCNDKKDFQLVALNEPNCFWEDGRNNIPLIKLFKPGESITLNIT